MPLQTIEPRRLYRQIAEQLRALIDRAEFAPATRLPPERDLAAQLGVSRPSVREALIALEVEGLVEVRPGSGIHVISPAGKLLAFRETPEDTITNCTFGGEDLKTLYVVCGSLLLSIRTKVPGKAAN